MEKLIKLGIILVILSLMSLAKCQGQIISSTSSAGVETVDCSGLLWVQSIEVRELPMAVSRISFEVTVSHDGLTDGKRLEKITNALLKAGRYSFMMLEGEDATLHVMMPETERILSSPTLDGLSETIKIKVIVPKGTVVLLPKRA